MGNLSQITETVRLAVDIPVYIYLADHCFEGKAVLPAVEALHLLATTVKDFSPDTETAWMRDVRFDKFLYLQTDGAQIAAFADISVHKNGDITANLLTKIRSKKSSITRIKEHASVRFPRIKPGLSDQPLDRTSTLEGICTKISSTRIYRDLVPFGPAYHNIRDVLHISEDGALAKTYAPPYHTESNQPGYLGSPFVLDAAFHAACVWGQRYERVVAFPVGFERRVIFKRTRPGETYFSRILPMQTGPDQLIFDIWIHDQNGRIFEAICGVRMRDVSSGRIKPPQWIISRGKKSPLGNITPHCRVLSVIEIETVLQFAEKTLSKIEAKRSQKMKDRRKRSYMAARLACKRLSRVLSNNDIRTSAADITTICPDQIHPCCPIMDGTTSFLCSVSHDNRFAVAVASQHRIGVDVEKISQRVLNSRRLYMSSAEEILARESLLNEIEASVRIWSIKEAVAKALDINLADAWNRVQVVNVKKSRSRVQIDSLGTYSAFHDTVNRHLFTIIEIP